MRFFVPELRPQLQAFLHDPDNGVYGDCHRTAIAMALGVDRDTVPHFCDPQQFDNYLVAQNEWLGARGYSVVNIPFSQCTFTQIIEQLRASANDAPVIVGGTSPRGRHHSVLVFDGQVFDPHPEGGNLIGPMDDGLFWLSIFSPTLRIAA